MFGALPSPVPALRQLLARHEEELDRRGLVVERPIGLLDEGSTATLAAIIIALFDARKTFMYFWEGLGVFPASRVRVFEGSADTLPRIRAEGLSPTLWWGPNADWFVATDIDSTSTYVGAPSSLARHILDEPFFEAYAIVDRETLDDS